MGSMLFTVFQYIPILEEEIHSSKSLKKNTTDSSEEDPTPEEESSADEDGDETFLTYTAFELNNPVCTHYYKEHQQSVYTSSIISISSPPPKV